MNNLITKGDHSGRSPGFIWYRVTAFVRVYYLLGHAQKLWLQARFVKGLFYAKATNQPFQVKPVQLRLFQLFDCTTCVNDRSWKESKENKGSYQVIVGIAVVLPWLRSIRP